MTADAQVGKRPDPESPAGVEYQLPLDEARNVAGNRGSDADRRGASSPRSQAKGKGVGASAQLFGVGIATGRGTADAESGRTATAGSDQTPQSSERGSLSHADDGAGSDGSRSMQQEVQRASVGAQDGDTGSAALQIGLIALAVVTAGGLLGLVLRRGLRTSES